MWENQSGPPSTGSGVGRQLGLASHPSSCHRVSRVFLTVPGAVGCDEVVTDQNCRDL